MGAPAFFISFFAGRRKNANFAGGRKPWKELLWTKTRRTHQTQPARHSRSRSSRQPGKKPQVIKWRGALSVSIAELELDGTVKAMLTIGKSSVPETIDRLPAAWTSNNGGWIYAFEQWERRVWTVLHNRRTHETEKSLDSKNLRKELLKAAKYDCPPLCDVTHRV